MSNDATDSERPHRFESRTEEYSRYSSKCFFHKHLLHVVLIRRNQPETKKTQHDKQKRYGANKHHRGCYPRTYHPYRPKYTTLTNQLCARPRVAATNTAFAANDY